METNGAKVSSHKHKHTRTTLGERDKASATNRLARIALYLTPPRRVTKASEQAGTEAQAALLQSCQNLPALGAQTNYVELEWAHFCSGYRTPL